MNRKGSVDIKVIARAVLIVVAAASVFVLAFSLIEVVRIILPHVGVAGDITILEVEASQDTGEFSVTFQGTNLKGESQRFAFYTNFDGQKNYIYSFDAGGWGEYGRGDKPGDWGWTTVPSGESTEPITFSEELSELTCEVQIQGGRDCEGIVGPIVTGCWGFGDSLSAWSGGLFFDPLIGSDPAFGKVTEVFDTKTIDFTDQEYLEEKGIDPPAHCES